MATMIFISKHAICSVNDGVVPAIEIVILCLRPTVNAAVKAQSLMSL